MIRIVVDDVFQLIAISIPVLFLAWLASRLLGIRRSALRSAVTGVLGVVLGVLLAAVSYQDRLPSDFDLAIRVAASCATVSVVGVYAERCEVHMGLAWIKALTLHTGQANVIGHLDRVLALMGAGVLDPGPLVTHHMSLADAPAAYELYDRREALKIVLEP